MELLRGCMDFERKQSVQLDIHCPRSIFARRRGAVDDGATLLGRWRHLLDERLKRMAGFCRTWEHWTIPRIYARMS